MRLAQRQRRSRPRRPNQRAVDRDRHHLRGAVDAAHREGVGQRVADIERLHRAVGVVERVDPDAGRCHREGAVAAGACRW